MTNVEQLAPALLTIPETANRLAVTEAAVRKWIGQRRLRVVKLGRLVRVRVQDVDAVVLGGLPAKGTYPKSVANR